MYALMALVFVLGYLCIAFEHPLRIDKAASALLTAVFAWTLLVIGADSIFPALESAANGNSNTHHVVESLRHHLGEISEILFFLMGAMTIVELIDAHDGFKAITDRIHTTKRVHLLWLVGADHFLPFPPPWITWPPPSSWSRCCANWSATNRSAGSTPASW